MKQPELGKKIIELRKKKGLTQEELVDKCKLNVRTLQRIESGEVNPRSYTIKIIFETLECEISGNPLDEKNRLQTYIVSTLKKINEQALNLKSMRKSKSFFYNYFLAIGIVWFLCGLSIVIFDLRFGEKEVLLTILIPLGFAIFQQFSKSGSSEVDQD
jgi:transcriptional regulator with XRE-family HTH domain